MACPGPSRRGAARRGLAAAVTAAFSASLAAQPAGLTVLHGSATVRQAGARTTITTTNGPGTRHSALDWRTFQVPGGSVVFFSQPDALSTSINRVLGGDPSRIAGTLGSNGRLVLVNPAGIAVAPGAVVDTAGFTASTLAMSPADAVAGRLLFGAEAGDDGGHGGKHKSGKAGSLEVGGQVLARQGDVVLIGPELEVGRGAVLEAQGGDVVLAAGRTVEVTGRGLEGIRMEVRAPKDRALNLGTLRGDSVAIFASQLRHSGVIEARSATLVGGKVILQAGEQAVLDGRIEAGNAAQGGAVRVSGDKLVLKAATVIDVSHLHGGGTILVGGGWARDAALPFARDVDVAEGVQLKAEATLSGPGGTVVVWSDDKLKFHGRISAASRRAERDDDPGHGGNGHDGGHDDHGPKPGKGGRVEVLAPDHVDYEGEIDLGQDGGGQIDPGMRVALVPREHQPQAVQAALREPEAETDIYVAADPWAGAPDTRDPDPRKRKVVIDAVRCTVTR